MKKCWRSQKQRRSQHKNKKHTGGANSDEDRIKLANNTIMRLKDAHVSLIDADGHWLWNNTYTLTYINPKLTYLHIEILPLIHPHTYWCDLTDDIFICKLFAHQSRSYYINAPNLYVHLSYYVMKDIFPHFPIVLFESHENKLETTYIDSMWDLRQQQKPFTFMLINVKADEVKSNLHMWLGKNATNLDAVMSIFAQLIFTIYAFHGMGAVANIYDLNAFTVVPISKTKELRYTFLNKTFRVLNTGYMVIFYHFDNATIGYANYLQDYVNCCRQIIELVPNVGTWLSGLMRIMERKTDLVEWTLMNTFLKRFEEQNIIQMITSSSSSYNLNATFLTQLDVWIQKQKQINPNFALDDYLDENKYVTHLTPERLKLDEAIRFSSVKGYMIGNLLDNWENFKKDTSNYDYTAEIAKLEPWFKEEDMISDIEKLALGFNMAE